MGVLQEMSANHVSKGVVFLVEGEDGTIWGACMQLSDYIGAGMWVWRGKHTSIGSLSNFLLTISEQKELESIQIVSLLLVCFGAPVYISMCHSSIACTRCTLRCTHADRGPSELNLPIGGVHIDLFSGVVASLSVIPSAPSSGSFTRRLTGGSGGCVELPPRWYGFSWETGFSPVQTSWLMALSLIGGALRKR